MGERGKTETSSGPSSETSSISINIDIDINSEKDDISTTSSDDALCDILGLPSLSGMTMVDDAFEGGVFGKTNTVGYPSSIPTAIPRRIELPSAKGVSRKYYQSTECFAFEIQDILSPEECLELIRVAATSSPGNNNPSSDLATSSFRYITHAIHTAPDGQTKFQVKLDKPNPHKLAVFQHKKWVKILWDRIKPLLHIYHHRHASNEASDSEAPLKNRESQELDSNHQCENVSLAKAIELFVQRESLSSSESSPIAGINPRLRVLKYDACDKDEFQGHFDATTEIHALGQTSYLTVLLYLNDGGGRNFDGGETEFLSQEDQGEEFQSLQANRTVKIVPKAGTAVLFEHDLFHRGRPLLWGTKYVLRTDIMFADPPKHSEETIPDAYSKKKQNGIEAKPQSKLSTKSHSKAAGMDLWTVDDVLSRIDEELRKENLQKSQKKIQPENALTLLRGALSEGLGFGGDLRDTTIECMCSMGRFALNIVLREHMQHQQHHQKIIDRFLDASFEALKMQKQ